MIGKNHKAALPNLRNRNMLGIHAGQRRKRCTREAKQMAAMHARNKSELPRTEKRRLLTRRKVPSVTRKAVEGG